MTRVLVASWAGSTNLGDELILAGLLGKLAARGCEVAVISIDPERTRDLHGVGAVSHRDPFAVWDAVGQADAVVFGGGGLVQDETSPFNLPYHLSRTWLARLRTVPWAGIGLGVGPLRTSLGRRLAAGLEAATAISVRDAPSARLAIEVGISQVRLAADLALCVPAPDVAQDDVIVVCLRPWTGGGGLLPVAARGHTADTPEGFVPAMARALDAAADATGLSVRFVSLQADRDEAVHRAVAERMDGPTAIASPGLDEVAAEVARGRVVVSMRYHGGICAVLGGRPAVLLDYSPKVGALAADLGAGATRLGLGVDDIGSIPGAIGDVIGRDDEVEAAREHLRSRERVNDDVLDQLLGG